MNDFWSRKLGGSTPAQQAQGEPQSHAPASSRPWWDQSTPVVTQAPQQPAQSYGQQQPGDLSPESIDHHTKSARLAKANHDRCPSCNSGNYVTTAKSMSRLVGMAETKRCFDCGYPVENRESGTPVTIAKGDAQRSRQVEHGGTVPNFAGSQTAAPSFASEQGGPGR